MSRLRAAAAADIDRLRARHPLAMRPPLRRRIQAVALLTVLLAAFIAGFAALESDGARFLRGFGQLAKIATLMLPPDYGTLAQLTLWSKALAETLAIALLGTAGAALLALPIGFLAARNVMPSWGARFLVRRSLDSLRGVDTLIWALIWINVVGLGPFAGVLAILTSDIGAFGKLFSEAIETADRRAGEGVVATGGSAAHRVRFGILPQVLPVLLAQVLYYFESNTRSATIIGIVGAGGIGLHLSEQIRTLEWQHVSFLIFMILMTVAAIDAISSRVRFAIIGTAPARHGKT